MGPQHEQFAIRHNPDDSYDSICLRCFRTVGTSFRQSELAAFERNHICETDAASETVIEFPIRAPEHLTRKAHGNIFSLIDLPDSPLGLRYEPPNGKRRA
jgi:hypothetical protein